MKAATLPQPHATLVALGAQTIVTTEHPTGHRGPLAIHAAQRPAETEDYEDGCVCGSIGDHSVMTWMKPVGKRGGWHYYVDGDGPHPLPLGAVVATARLLDVVPITQFNHTPRSTRHHVTEYPAYGDLPHQRGGPWLIGPGPPNNGTPTNISDQLPYADFTPGRWAWLLDDVKATTDRCPVCMGESILHGDGDGGDVAYTLTICPTCDGDGTCPPIPAKGHTGLWNWTP